MVFNRTLGAARDDEDVVDTARHRLLDDELQDGLVDDRQHLLGMDFVAGRNRVPMPAAGMTALRTPSRRSVVGCC